MNIPPLSIEIPLTQTQTDPLVTFQHQTTSSSEVMAYFGEDDVVSMGKYYWNKKYKAVVKRGTKRAREGLVKQVPAHNQVIWKSDTTDVHQGALDTKTTMGVFTGANFDSVSQICLVLSDKEKELQKSKLYLAAVEHRHEQ